MDIQSRLTSDRGAVTIEAAIAAAALLCLFSMLAQAAAFGVTSVRLLAVAQEAAAIAASSGPAADRADQARRWAGLRVPWVLVVSDGSEITVTAGQRLHLLGGAWNPRLRVSASAVRIDDAAWL